MSAVIRERSELAAALGARRPERRVVLANGCFDFLHVGHLRYLNGAKACGDVLVVALNDDESVRLLKGASRPLVPLEERLEVVAGLRAVDYVTWFAEPTLEQTLRVLRPNVHAKGTDYTLDDLPERDVDRELGIEIAFCGDEKTHHARDLVARLRGGQPG